MIAINGIHICRQSLDAGHSHWKPFRTAFSSLNLKFLNFEILNEWNRFLVRFMILVESLSSCGSPYESSKILWNFYHIKFGIILFWIFRDTWGSLRYRILNVLMERYDFYGIHFIHFSSSSGENRSIKTNIDLTSIDLTVLGCFFIVVTMSEMLVRLSNRKSNLILQNMMYNPIWKSISDRFNQVFLDLKGFMSSNNSYCDSHLFAVVVIVIDRCATQLGNYFIIFLWKWQENCLPYYVTDSNMPSNNHLFF